MSLTIRIVSAPEHSNTLPQYCFDGRDGTIGRDAQADIVLDDPYARIEDTHAAFRCTTAGYILTDTSRDGVFINNRQDALGHGTDYLLQDGDMLGIGAFRLLVSCFSPLNCAPPPLNTTDEETALCSLFTPADDNSCFDDDPFLGTAPVKNRNRMISATVFQRWPGLTAVRHRLRLRNLKSHRYRLRLFYLRKRRCRRY